MVVDYFVAELLKLAKRPASWVLGSILVLSLVLLGYLSAYFFVLSVQNGDAPPGIDPRETLQTILPEDVLANVLAGFPKIGGAIALIFGALVVGSEYGWGTLKLILSQRPGRLEIFSGKILAIGAALAMLSIVMLLAGVLCSYTVAGLQDEPMNWPAFGEMLKGLGAGWLVLAAWASLGIFLATLFRGASLAIGVGLAYALAIETFALALPIQGDTFERIQKTFVGKNAGDLASSFSQSPQGPSVGGIIDPTHAVIVLVVYAAAFLLVSALLFRRRDL